MCGLSGVIARDPAVVVPEEWIRDMMAVQAHRGPDDAATLQFPGCRLGFNRLSIQDVSELGRQPMVVEGSSSAIVFNGEIYNFIELGRDLQARGVRFRSHSDTEVLLRAFLEKGEAAFEGLNGMFAFLIYDPDRDEWLAARDRFGVKPLYYFQDDKYFAFASEIKGLLTLPFVPRRPDMAVLFSGAFGRGNDRWPGTCFEEVWQVPPAHVLRMSRRSWSPSLRRYWSIPPSPPEKEITVPERARLQEEFRELLFSAVSLRLRSDRPVGLLLSSGVDSSCIAAAVATLAGRGGSHWAGDLPRFFTMSLPGEAIDESPGALRTCRSLGVPGQAIPVDRADFDRLIPETLWHNDEPLPYLNRCVHWGMMEEVARQGVIVVLNGQGGDETTGGYVGRLLGSTLAMALLREGVGGFLAEWRAHRSYRGYSHRWMLSQLPKPYLSHRWVRAFQALSKERALELATLSFVSAGLLHDAHARRVRGDDVNDQLLKWLVRDTVPDLCHYEDRNSAAHGLEERFPFLDYRIAEFMFRLPWFTKIHRGISKVLVRESMRGVVPDFVLDSRKKIGLEVPEDKWIAGPLSPLVQDLAASRSFRERGWWRADSVRRLIRRHIAGEVRAGNLIWRIVGTEMWCRMFLDRVIGSWERVASSRVVSRLSARP
jgi:asparagine synthase (glutamine-hydrolysing)